MALSRTFEPSPELTEGLSHLAAARWDAAVVSLRIAASREPGRLAAARALATAYLRVGEPGSARTVLAAFTLICPMCAEGWRLAAQLEWKLNCRPEALKLLARGLDHLPNSPVLHRQMALFSGATGDLDRSARHADEARGAGGRVAQCVSAARREATADRPILGAGEKAAPVDPDWLDRVVQDAKLLESVLALPQNAADLPMFRALELKLGQLLEAQPHHADRQLSLARVQVRIGASDAAMLSVQRSLRANPNYVDAHRLRATLCAEAGDHDGAISILENLIKRGNDWPDIHLQVAQMQQLRGQAEAARSHVYSAIRLNPKFQKARAMLDRFAA